MSKRCAKCRTLEIRQQKNNLEVRSFLKRMTLEQRELIRELRQKNLELQSSLHETKVILTDALLDTLLEAGLDIDTVWKVLLELPIFPKEKKEVIRKEILKI